MDNRIYRICSINKIKRQNISVSFIFDWQGNWESNPDCTGLKADVLPNTLLPLAGATGFEPVPGGLEAPCLRF